MYVCMQACVFVHWHARVCVHVCAFMFQGFQMSSVPYKTLPSSGDLAQLPRGSAKGRGRDKHW